jgi:single-strand DNA-binding protein
MAVNTITIEGNLGSDPELKVVKDETLSTFSLAYTPRKKINGQWEDGETLWFRVTLWNSKSDLAQDNLKKGDKVIVIGTLSQSNFVNKAGEAKSSLEINANSFSIVPRSQNRGSNFDFNSVVKTVEDVPSW